jgi:hypothetical protein
MPLVLIKSDQRAREKPCLRCGYSLRKLDATHCPECGLSVWLSLNQNDSLAWSRPEWLRRMALGLWVMAAAQIPGLVAYLLAIPQYIAYLQWEDQVTQAYGSGATPPPPPTPNVAYARMSMAFAAVYLLVYHAGLLLLTWHERRYPDRLRNVRIGSWITSGAAALVALLVLAGMYNPVVFHFWWILVKVVALASAFVTWLHLKRMAQRIPKAALVRVCSILLLVPVLGFLKVFPFLTLYLIASFSWLLDVLPVVYLPGAAVLFVWFAVIFRRDATSAAESWGSETAVTR